MGGTGEGGALEWLREQEGVAGDPAAEVEVEVG